MKRSRLPLLKSTLLGKSYPAGAMVQKTSGTHPQETRYGKQSSNIMNMI